MFPVGSYAAEPIQGLFKDHEPEERRLKTSVLCAELSWEGKDPSFAEPVCSAEPSPGCSDCHRRVAPLVVDGPGAERSSCGEGRLLEKNGSICILPRTLSLP